MTITLASWVSSSLTSHHHQQKMTLTRMLTLMLLELEIPAVLTYAQQFPLSLLIWIYR